MTDTPKTDETTAFDTAEGYAKVGIDMASLGGTGIEGTEAFATLMAMMAVVADLQEKYSIPADVIHTVLDNAQRAKELILAEVTKNG